MKKSKIIITILVVALLVFAGFSAFAANDEQVTQENDAKKLNEIVEKRTLSSKAYAMSDGTVRHDLFATDIHYEDDNGNLKEIDIKVKDIDTAKNNGYNFKNGENSWDVYFADKGKAKDLVELVQDDYSISFSLDNAKSNAVAGKSTEIEKGKSELHDYYIEDPTVVMYSDVTENVDLAYTIREHYLKEDIILNAVPETNEFTFTIMAKNLNVTLKDNRLEYNDAKNGENVFYTDSLFMEDSKNNVSTDLTMKLIDIGNGKYELKIIADEKFIKSESTVYPVVIDPTVTIQNEYTKDVFVASYMPTTNMNALSTRMPYLRTGKDSDYGIRRTYIEFRSSDIDSAVGPNDTITSAYVSLKRYSSAGTIDLSAYKVTEYWTSGSGGSTHIYWNDYTSFDGNTTYPDSSSNDWYSMYITNLVQGWESGSIPNYGVMIKDSNESSTSVWATFRSSDNWLTTERPRLVINTTTVTPTPTPAPNPTYYVDLAVTCDESYRNAHTNWESDAGDVLELADNALSREFDIDFYYKTYVSWTSPADQCDTESYCEECTCSSDCPNCTCGTPGHCDATCYCQANGLCEYLEHNNVGNMVWDALTYIGNRDYVTAFTNHSIYYGEIMSHIGISGYGITDVSIIESDDHYISNYNNSVPFLHEISHSYGCIDDNAAHTICDGNCIMSYYTDGEGKCYFRSENDWCNHCKAIIMTNRNLYGNTTP